MANATNNQIQFINNLLKEKDLTESTLEIPTNLSKLSAKDASDLITKLLGFKNKPGVKSNRSDDKATIKQVQFIKDLRRRKQIKSDNKDLEKITKSEANKLIDELKNK